MAKAAKKGSARKGSATSKATARAGARVPAARRAKRPTGQAAPATTAGEARRVADHGSRVREQVRAMTSSALRGETPSPERVGGLFRDVMQGTVEAIDRALPPGLRSDRFREAVERFAHQFERIAHEAKAAGNDALEPLVKAAKVAGEHPVAAMQDSMRSGARVAAGAASRLMSATGGAISGLAEGLAEAAEHHERAPRRGTSRRRS